MELVKVIENLVKSLVVHHDQVQILEEKREDGLVFTATVAKEDMGSLIGKRGRSVEALRTIIRACGVKAGTRITFQVEDKEEEGE